MSYRNSVAVPPETVRQHGCFTTLPVRRSLHEPIAVETSRLVFEEWNRLVGPAEMEMYCFDPHGHMVSLTWPECIPERIPILTRIMDVGLLHDDVVDNMNAEEARSMNQGFADGFGSGKIRNGDYQTARISSAKKQIEAKVLLDLITIDKEDAFSIMDSWKRYLDNGSGSRSADDFQTLEEWIPYRREDAALPLAIELCSFALGIRVTQSQRDSVAHIIKPISTAAALMNDYYSYQKEYNQYIAGGRQDGIPNSVSVLMREHDINADEALSRLRHKILELEDECSKLRLDHETSSGVLPQNVKAYIDAVQMVLSGASFWSSFTARYNRYRKPKTLPEVTEEGFPNARVLPEAASPLHYASKKSKTSLHSNGISTNGVASFSSLRFTTITPQVSSDLSEELILAPYEYLRTLPSKGVRDVAIDSLNIWFGLPHESLASIKAIVTYLHTASLMLDDIEDSSPLRRGKPAAHEVFGVSQTINSATYLFALSIRELQQFKSPRALSAYAEELKNLHQGQGLELNQTHHVECPTITQYLYIVDNKTGGLFRLLGKLLKAESSFNSDMDIEPFLTLLGRYFQIRDDYQNLFAPDYALLKGECEDLDEGKFSLPIIHSFHHSTQKSLLRSIYQQRRQKGTLSSELKRVVLDIIREAGSLDFTRAILLELENVIITSLEILEKMSGQENFVLRLLIERLRIR